MHKNFLKDFAVSWNNQIGITDNIKLKFCTATVQKSSVIFYVVSPFLHSETDLRIYISCYITYEKPCCNELEENFLQSVDYLPIIIAHPHDYVDFFQ